MKKPQKIEYSGIRVDLETVERNFSLIMNEARQVKADMENLKKINKMRTDAIKDLQKQLKGKEDELEAVRSEL